MSQDMTTAGGPSTILRSASLRRGSRARWPLAPNLATGDLTFSATNLDDLSPLVLTKLTGALQAKASASVADGKQMLSVTANSDRMTIDANRLEGLKVDFKIADLWGAKLFPGSRNLRAPKSAGSRSPASS